MAWVEYIARRRLAPGHFAGSQYILPLTLTACDLMRRVDRREKRSLSGRSESLYYYGKEEFRVQLAAIRLDRADLVLEFLHSTEDGQPFTFDPYGSPSRPVAEMFVVRSDEAHSANRVLMLGQGGHDDYVQFSFSVREA